MFVSQVLFKVDQVKYKKERLKWFYCDEPFHII